MATLAAPQRMNVFTYYRGTGERGKKGQDAAIDDAFRRHRLVFFVRHISCSVTVVFQ
jgi:hypothetical protein